MKTKMVVVTLVFALVAVFLTANFAHAGWMEGKIVKASLNNDGGTIIKFYRASNQSYINAYLDESADAKTILAIALTAISLDADVDIFYDWGTKTFMGLAIK